MPSVLLQKSSDVITNRLNRLPYLSLEGIKGLYLFLRGQFLPTQIAEQLGATEKEIWHILQEQPMLSSLPTLSPKDEASWMELNMFMQNQLLRDVDVMSMAHGVEIRVPFLDDSIIKTVLSIKSGIKYEGHLPKQILINAFKDKLPEQIWKRKKMGFSFPFTNWLSNSVFIKDTMGKSNASTQLNYKRFKEGKLHWSHLMSLIILQNRGV
jgi:asparagine synthase (glutamine-hydrolysing)